MKIFIIPYRNREAQMHVFLSHMKYLLEDIPEKDYRIYLVNQVDARPFNRGAMRNIGFLEGKKRFPDTYKEIDFVFHDLDNLVGKKNSVTFTTVPNKVNHIFGNYDGVNIGGIFVMKGGDFEKVNGYPNFWGWGYEDTALGIRCRRKNIECVRKTFSWKDKRIVHLDYTPSMPVAQKIENRFNKNTLLWMKKGSILKEGVDTIKDIHLQERSFSSSVKILNVTHFNCNISEKNYSPYEIWLVMPNFLSWLKTKQHLFQKNRLV